MGRPRWPLSALRRWGGRLGLVAGGLALGLLGAEIAARVLKPDDAADLLFNASDNAPGGLYTSDRRLVHRPTAGFRATISSLGYNVDLRVNSYSCRGPEPGPKQGARWLAAGDSFTFAAQVAEDDTFAQRLGATAGIEFINAAADGYGTWQAMRRYEDLDPELDLDGMLLTFFVGNDLADDHLFESQARRAQGFAEEVPLMGMPRNPLVAFLSEHSYLYGQWHVHQRQKVLADPRSDERQRWQNELRMFTVAGSDWMTKHSQASREALARLKDAAHTRGDELVVAVAPPAFQVLPDRAKATFALVGLEREKLAVDGPSDAVLAMLGDLGIRSCDLVLPLRAAAAQGKEVYFRYDGHWTVEGHAVVAEAMRACLAGS